MNKAENVEEFIKEIADLVGCGESVGYNLETLEFGQLNEMQLFEYSEYIEMEELPEDIGEELHDWEIDCVKYLRWALDLPHRMDPPSSRWQFTWMEMFAEAQSADGRFIRDVNRALNSRHPFGAYKDVMRDYGLLDDWYKYRDEFCRAYVRHELGLGSKWPDSI